MKKYTINGQDVVVDGDRLYIAVKPDDTAPETMMFNIPRSTSTPSFEKFEKPAKTNKAPAGKGLAYRECQKCKTKKPYVREGGLCKNCRADEQEVNPAGENFLYGRTRDECDRLADDCDGFATDTPRMVDFARSNGLTLTQLVKIRREIKKIWMEEQTPVV